MIPIISTKSQLSVSNAFWDLNISKQITHIKISIRIHCIYIIVTSDMSTYVYNATIGWVIGKNL